MLLQSESNCLESLGNARYDMEACYTSFTIMETHLDHLQSRNIHLQYMKFTTTHDRKTSDCKALRQRHWLGTYFPPTATIKDIPLFKFLSLSCFIFLHHLMNFRDSKIMSSSTSAKMSTIPRIKDVQLVERQLLDFDFYINEAIPNVNSLMGTHRAWYESHARSNVQGRVVA